MQYKTTFKTIPLADIVECPYNPRVAIERDTPEYDALRRSLEQHEVVEPLVVNIHNMRCVGGNQRLAVMRDMGITEALCSIIDQPDEVQEKKLCLALNRIDGRWDTDKLGDLLRDDDVLEWETGFDEAEVRLYRQLEDAQEPDADDDAEDLDDLEDEDQEEPEGDDEEEDAPEEGTINTTVIRIGHYSFKVEYSAYKRLVDTIMDDGIFSGPDIEAEIKRRLPEND